jgi:eukaryotic-like serine/threonine-protein kinase
MTHDDETPSERWRRVERVYLSALGCTDVERSAVLADLCSGDEALRRDVESLLRVQPAARSFLDAGAMAVAAEIVRAELNTDQESRVEHHRVNMMSIIGRRLGVYEIRAVIGSGGMGDVYRARDTRLERDVAIKILPPAFTGDVDLLARFEREARALASMDHPNIATIHAVEDSDGVLALVLALVDGETLRARLERERLPLDAALDIIIQIVTALAAAHAAGVIHRDVKPENVMIRRDGLVKVVDFGLAKAFRGATSDIETVAATQSGIVLGTVAYMSPEQARGLAVDARSDLFAVGAIMYEMLAGRPAFTGQTPSDVLAAVLAHQPEPLIRHRPGVSGDLSRIVGRCLAKDRALRYQSARDLLAELEAIRKPHEADRNAASAEPSIAVLPFANLSPEPDNEFFADGLMDEVIADLAGVRSLRVISRTSAMRFKRTAADVRTIARELGVRYILEGSVRRAALSLRVTVQLIDADTDSHLWGEKYSGRAEDVFAIQEEISRKIVEALQVRLTDREARALAERPIENLAAYECYLRARHDITTVAPDSLNRARRLVNDGLAIMGENPLLLATKAYVEWQYVNMSVGPAEQHLNHADAFAGKALVRDPDCYLAILARGLVAARRGDIERALPDLRRAAELKPGDGAVLAELGRHAFNAGQELREWARERIEDLPRVDPLTPAFRLPVAGWHFSAGRLESEAQEARTVERLSERESPVRIFAAWHLCMAGERDEATRILTDLAAVLPATPYAAFGSLASFFLAALRGRNEAAIHVTSEVEEAAYWNEYVALFLAEGYGLLRRPADAVRWLRVCIARGFVNYPFLAERDPFLQPVRDDAAFQGLMGDLRQRWEAIS